MLGIALAGWTAVLASLPGPALQDTGTVDAPVYENSTYGVSVPRPFDDWVFEPGVGRRTISVIFHPRTSPLREQLWGALVLTAFPGRATLGQVADQRVQVAWRPQLGSTFALLSRDSLAVAGFPAVHVVMSGAISQVVLEAEEYVIARGGDLVVLQFRYPRGLPRDSVAAGYQRVLAGLKLGAAIAAAPTQRPALSLADSVATPHLLPWSPWQALAYDALVRFDTARVRLDFVVRVSLVNEGAAPADSVAVWLPPVFALDSARTAAARLPTTVTGTVSRLALPDSAQPQAAEVVTLFYHVSADSATGPLPPGQLGLVPRAAYVAAEWLPRVQPMLDSTGQGYQTDRPRFTLRLDVPEAWRAVAPGRLESDVASLGRRRLTWVTDDVLSAVPAFALGPYREVVYRSGGLAVSIWLAPADTLPAAEDLAAAVRRAWVFCSRAFGRLPIGNINVVRSGVPETRGFAGFVLLGQGTQAFSQGVLISEIARNWWGNSVAAAGPGSGWVVEAFPAWAAVAGRGAMEGDTVRQRLVRQAEAAWRSSVMGGRESPLALVGPYDARSDLLRSKGVAAIEAARRAMGEADFREAILTITVEHRNGWASLDELLAAFGSRAQAVLRPFLF